MVVSLIAAADEKNVIGHAGSMPWGVSLKADLKFFKDKTVGHAVIMGRKTYESIGRPLQNRTNIIVSRQTGFSAPGCSVVDSLEQALDVARGLNETEAFIIGGQSLYEQGLKFADKIYLTRVHGEFRGDTYFPSLGPEWKKTEEEKHQKDDNNSIDYTFQTWNRITNS